MSQLPSVSVAIEESELTTNLISTLLFTFLMGIYTIVYFGTLYAYLTRRASERRLVVATITILYLISAVEFGIQCWEIEWQYIKNGETRDTAFIAYFYPPQWFGFINDFNTFSVIVLADGLLIWRCFHLWSRSLCVMALPVLLWVAEIVLTLSTIIVSGESGFSFLVSQQLYRISESLETAQTLLSLLTTVVTTFLIAYRIHSVFKQNSSSMRRFKNILDIVVQSSFFYSLTLLVSAISYILATKQEGGFNVNISALDDYSDAISLVAPGLMSTVMVARIAFQAPGTTDPSTPHISDLQSQGHSTTATDIRTQPRMRSIIIMQTDSRPA